jgi:hypothetical protein
MGGSIESLGDARSAYRQREWRQASPLLPWGNTPEGGTRPLGDPCSRKVRSR